MDVESILAIIFLFGGGTVVALAYSPVGKAFTDRIRHGKQPQGVDSAVYEELDALRADVTELQERVDFAERMLAKGTGEPEVPAS